MLSIPTALMSKFNEQLQIRAIPGALQGAYQKWLRYYLDFCQKYHSPPKHEKSLPPFMQKLQEKRQSKVQQEQAAAAIMIYYGILRETGKIGMDHPLKHAGPPVSSTASEAKKMSLAGTPAMYAQPETIASPPSGGTVPMSKIESTPNPSGVKENANHEPAAMVDPDSFPAGSGTGASWKSEYIRLADEISIRHYSLKTLKTYRAVDCGLASYWKNRRISM